MGTVKNVELSMQSVRRLLERNHLAYTIEKDSLLFNRRFNRRTGQKILLLHRLYRGREENRSSKHRVRMCRLQCLRRRFCNGHMLSSDDVYRHGVFRIPFSRPLSRFLSDRRIQRLERMTRTADFADGLTTDCKVCFYVMTK